MIACRALTAVAAACFVLAVAIDLLAPLGLNLAGGMQRLDDGSVAALQQLLLRHGAGGVWTMIALPLLRRPAWMLPVVVGLVSAGLAVSIGRQARGDLHRRR